MKEPDPVGRADQPGGSDVLYFEDLGIGDVRDLGSFVLLVDEMIEFARRFDPAPFHVDADLAAESFFGGIVASGLHTLSALYRVLYDGLMSQVALAAGRRVTFQLPTPVRPGERIDVRSTVTEARDSPKRPAFGIVVITAEATNPAGKVAMVATFEALVRRRTVPDPLSPDEPGNHDTA